MAVILVVDDDKSIVDSFFDLFRDKHTVLGAYNGKEADKIIKEKEVDLVYLDYRLPGEDGLEVLKKIKASSLEIYVIIITAYVDLETIIQSISLGAYDYIEKPLDIDKINILTKRALESKKMTNFVNYFQDEQIKNYSFKEIIGKSQVMQNIFKSIGKLVNNDITVLITGESGTGKELIARALHYNSYRKKEPFIAINCSGLTDSLLENELFGHEAQAFTGADSQKSGKFEAVGEGTIFLDEIGDIPISTQKKLLRVLQEKEFQRLGSIKNINLKARIIAATNKDLDKKIKDGSFREDFFYRINVATIQIPSLNERQEDIPDLVDHFIKKTCYKLKKDIKGISDEAIETLKKYNWPGNIRELENVIIQICINKQSNFIHLNDIPKYILSSKTGKDIEIFDEFIEKFSAKYNDQEKLLSLMCGTLEKKMINLVMQQFDNNKSTVSKKLGISRVTLDKKLLQIKKST